MINAQKISELRKQKALSHRALAEKLNVSKSLITRIEAGTKDPSVRLLTAMAEFFECTVDELIVRNK